MSTLLPTPPIFRYSYLFSLDATTDRIVRNARTMVQETLKTSFAGRTYKPHITVFYFDREEDDKAVVRQVMPLLTILKKISLLIDTKKVFDLGTTDAIVYTFQNPEEIKKLQIKLKIIHPKKSNHHINPHITTARELPKYDSAIYDSLPSHTGHLVECTSLQILKQLIEKPYDPYTVVYNMQLK